MMPVGSFGVSQLTKCYQNFMKSNLNLDKLNKNFVENVCLLSHFPEVPSTYKCLLYLVTSFLENQ